VEQKLLNTTLNILTVKSSHLSMFHFSAVQCKMATYGVASSRYTDTIFYHQSSSMQAPLNQSGGSTCGAPQTTALLASTFSWRKAEHQ